MHHISEILTFPIKAAYPNPFKFLQFPDQPRVNYPLFYLLLAGNSALIANLVALSWLWDWGTGWILLVGIITTLYLLSLIHRTVNVLIDEVRMERDKAVEDFRSLEDEIMSVTDEFLLHDNQGHYCRICQSRHPLLDDPRFRFNPFLHNRGCEIPVWRSKVEAIDLSLPQDM